MGNLVKPCRMHCTALALSMAIFQSSGLHLIYAYSDVGAEGTPERPTPRATRSAMLSGS